MRAKMLLFVSIAVLSAWMAQARDPVPVYGPARVAVEDVDLLGDTILELGTLAVTPGEIWKVVIGDGLTPGGIPIHPENCVTGFNGVAIATTNLDMRSWSIKWGPWTAHGDANEWDLGYAGTDETWLRLVRDSGQAYLAYTFTIVDAMHYRFELAWTGDSEAFPVLQVATNLAAGYDPYADADPADVTYTQPDASHLVIDYAVPDDYVFLAFRLFAASRLESGAYFSVPVHATGGLTLDGTNVATVADVATVAGDLAAHESATNPHGITPDLIGMRLWLTLRGLAISSDISEGFSHLFGFDEYLSFEEYMWKHNVPNVDFTLISTNSSTWNFSTVSRPKWNNVGLATTGDVATAVSSLSDTVADWVGDVANDLARATNALSADIATNAAAIGALDGRVGALEDTAWPMDTTFVYWPPEALSSTQTNWIPTNWPSRNIELYIHDTGVVPCIVALTNWTPAQDCRITIHINSSTTPATNRNFRLQIGTSTPSGATTANTGSRKTFQLSWIASIARWQYNTYTPPGGESMYESSGRGGVYETPRAYSTFPDSAFLPVHSTSEEE